MMRQAGRYLPEYRELRASASFWERCQDPALASEITLQPIRRFDFDAAIIFSDILLPLLPMGAHFEFEAGGGPRLKDPFDSAAKLAHLRDVDVRRELPWTLEALQRVRAQLDASKALLGFAGAPFTLLCYLVEGEGSKLFPTLKRLLFTQPGLCESVLARLAQLVGDYLLEQARAGADAVQLFDTWAGLLHPEDYERFALPYARAAFEPALAHGVPTIYYVHGGPALLHAQIESGCDVIGVDWRQRLSIVRTIVPADRAIQGNLDPLVLLADPATVRARTQRMLDEMEGRPGYIVNLGHGVLPQTPLESVAAFVETVRGAQTHAA
jgi:uroporphyrinogen decarboxylase